MKRSRAAGFTLIEIIVALALFALVSVLSASVIQRAFDTRARLAITLDRMNDLQDAISVFMRDTASAQNRPVRSTDMHLLPAFVGETDYMEFSRGGLVNPEAQQPHSSYQRVAWRCTENQLVRRSWLTVDGPTHTDFHDRVILTDLSACNFAYIARNNQHLSEWRPYAVQQNQRREPLPSAVVLTVAGHDLDSTALLFVIPEALYGA